MEKISSSIQNIYTGKQTISLYVPNADEVKQLYQQNAGAFPYWSQIWPAAIGLCYFLENNKDLLENKTVLEIAAGLGLPSLLAAQYCASITMTDYLPEPVELMTASIHHNHLSNATAQILNWNDIPESINADVLLMSDINYEPPIFETVFGVIQRFIISGATIILSTPQRLMAKPFIERLFPWCSMQEEVIVARNNETIPVTILVLGDKTSFIS
ncbi:MAG: methyltransferase [Chitinophagaceae bacterium]|nr:methyltransferase [Chitinophagaceae bacterium]